MWPRIVFLALIVFRLAGAQSNLTNPGTPRLRADPAVDLVDAPLRITASGLVAKQLVRITATSRTSTDRALIAYAVFRADESGNIDVSTAKPLDGTYSKADAMGLFWSMAPQPVPVEIWTHLDLPRFRPPDPWTVLLEVAPEAGG